MNDTVPNLTPLVAHQRLQALHAEGKNTKFTEGEWEYEWDGPQGDTPTEMMFPCATRIEEGMAFSFVPEGDFDTPITEETKWYTF